MQNQPNLTFLRLPPTPVLSPSYIYPFKQQGKEKRNKGKKTRSSSLSLTSVFSLTVNCFLSFPLPSSKKKLSNFKTFNLHQQRLSSSHVARSVLELRGLKSYVSGIAYSKHVILLISDDFGYEAPNLRKLAVKVAAAGYSTVAPDLFMEIPVCLRIIRSLCQSG